MVTHQPRTTHQPSHDYFPEGTMASSGPQSALLNILISVLGDGTRNMLIKFTWEAGSEEARAAPEEMGWACCGHIQLDPLSKAMPQTSARKTGAASQGQRDPMETHWSSQELRGQNLTVFATLSTSLCLYVSGPLSYPPKKTLPTAQQQPLTGVT